MEEFTKDKFKNLTEADKFQRIDICHPIPWYIGIDSENRYSLFAIIESQPQPVTSSRMMNVFMGTRKDGNYGITFSLREEKNIELFSKFCDDMIEYTRNIESKDSDADYICGRYIQWQNAFIKTGGKVLSFEIIKGLIGELTFLVKHMFEKYGEEKAIDSWMGLAAADQDFSCDETWYEVKTTVSGSLSVKISSIEQLDIDKDGHLVVVYLDKISPTNGDSISLNNLVNYIYGCIQSKISREKFMNKLLLYGYFHDDSYDNVCFKYNGMNMYKVDSKFPCIRKGSLPNAVQKVRYDLVLSAIDDYRES